MSAVMVQLGGHKPSGPPVRGWAQIDEEDAADVLRYRWSLSCGYAVRFDLVDGRYRTVRMHRQILGLIAGDGVETDHVNRDKLDNRRENLRATTHALNCQNAPNYERRGRTARFRGVRMTTVGRWQAHATVNGSFKHLGVFADPDEAAAVARAFRVEHMAGAVD